MNEEILQELQRMNDILVGIAIMLLFGLVLWTIRGVMSIYQFGKEIKSKAWNDEANSLYSKGKNEKLLRYSISRLGKEPKNPTALYWKAKAERDLGKEEDLRKTVQSLLEETPKWKEDWMDEYMKPK